MGTIALTGKLGAPHCQRADPRKALRIRRSWKAHDLESQPIFAFIATESRLMQGIARLVQGFDYQVQFSPIAACNTCFTRRMSLARVEHSVYIHSGATQCRQGRTQRRDAGSYLLPVQDAILDNEVAHQKRILERWIVFNMSHSMMSLCADKRRYFRTMKMKILRDRMASCPGKK